MKKWMSLLLVGIVASVVLTGCAKKEEGTPETANPSASDADGGKMEEKK